MKLIIQDNSALVGEWAAKYVMKRIIDFKPSADKYFVLGLPTGSTPMKMYQHLVEYNKAGKLSFKYVKTFNMDEYVGLPVVDGNHHKESYHHFMFHNLFKVNDYITFRCLFELPINVSMILSSVLLNNYTIVKAH